MTVLLDGQQSIYQNCARREAAPQRLKAWRETPLPYQKAKMMRKWGPNMLFQYVETEPETNVKEPPRSC